MYYYPQQQQQQYAATVPYMQPQAQAQVQNQVQGLKGRPVSSIEEARAAQIDFDGSLFVFPDLANKRIYTKQINLDGTASLNVYELKEMVVPKSDIDYVTKQEFETVVKELSAAVQNIAASIQPVEAQPPAAINFK
jgi:hypothetical protein